MNIDRISVTIQHTISVENFENITPSVTLEALLEAADDRGKCFLLLHNEAESLWRLEAAQQLKAVIKRRVTSNSDPSVTQNQKKSVDYPKVVLKALV